MSFFKRAGAVKVSLVAAAVVASAIAVLSTTGPASATAANAGSASMINPATNSDIAAGGSTTTWSFKLPTGAACTGDSATGGYFVYSYLTPAANSPANLTFDPSNGPSQPAGSFAYPLFDTSGSAYTAKTTAPNSGGVKDFPGTQFDFARFTIDGSNDGISLPAGSYNIGIACYKSQTGTPAAQDKYWNGTVTFAANSGDPSGEAWTQGTPPPPTTTTVAPTTTTTIAPTTTTVAPTTTTVAPTTTTVAPTTTTVGPTTTTTPTQPPVPCQPPTGVVSKLVYGLGSGTRSLGVTLCQLGL